jgi:hypothetical protein
MLDSTNKNYASVGLGRFYTKLSDAGYGFGSYGSTKNQYSYAVNIVMLNYGTIPMRDALGESTGSRQVSDYVVGISVSRPITPFLSLGCALKPVFSKLVSTSSAAITGDVGLCLHDSASLTVLTVVARNAGITLKPYNKDQKQKMPFEIDLGFSKKFLHAPLRISVTYTNLQKFDINYRQQEQSSMSLQEDSSKTSKFSTFSNNFIPHLVVGAELLVSKYFYASAGYNIRRRNEMKTNDKAGSAGLALGVGIRVAKIHMSYGHQFNSMVGGTNTFTLCTNLDKIFRTFARKNPPASDKARLDNQ